MSEKNTGGPAFPTTPECYENMEPAGEGMTLRDYFAAKAMAAMLSSDKILAMSDNAIDAGFGRAEWISKQSFDFADAMLKARES